MPKLPESTYSKITDSLNFYRGADPHELLAEYGSPLYIYNEGILRKSCRDIMSLVSYPKFKVNYSPKANNSLALLQIIKQEGLDVDAMSPGEIYVNMKAGFPAERIFYVGNNVSDDEMLYAINRNILVSVDSLSQLDRYGRLNSGGKVSLRINPGIGAGHHEKVVTAGTRTKFGINIEYANEAIEISKRHNLKVVGLNQHIGSLFMDSFAYTHAFEKLLEITDLFDELDFVDLGGGFGVPYRKQDGEARLDLAELGNILDDMMWEHSRKTGRMLTFKAEPGRYIAAESAVLLGTVHSVKNNGDTKYIGCDIGFNVILRPSMYSSHHDIEVYRKNGGFSGKTEIVTVVGNICETGDILAPNRELPEIMEGDVLAVLDAGAYCFSMSSNYNSRLRPAEVLITEDSTVLIRQRDTLEELVSKMLELPEKPQI